MKRVHTDFEAAFAKGEVFLLEGALGERLKRDFGLLPDPNVALAVHGTTKPGRAALEALWKEYAGIAAGYGLPFLATTPTRRADRDRVSEGGFDESLIRENVRFLRAVLEDCLGRTYLGGMMGCRGDAYTGKGALPREKAAVYHQWQAEILAEERADFLYGALLPTLPEALGMAQAMAETGLPYILSFTLRRDGCLIDGTPLADAMQAVDGAVSPPPLCFMTNCIHPALVYEALSAPWNQPPQVRARFRGIQGNTSPLSYEELDRAADLLTADPVSFARDTVRLRELGNFQIFGGCCGTDGRHLRQIAKLLSAGQ